METKERKSYWKAGKLDYMRQVEHYFVLLKKIFFKKKPFYLQYHTLAFFWHFCSSSTFYSECPYSKLSFY